MYSKPPELWKLGSPHSSGSGSCVLPSFGQQAEKNKPGRNHRGVQPLKQAEETWFESLCWRRVNKLDTGKEKTDLCMMWRQACPCGLFCMTRKVPHLILRDEPVGLHRLLPLQEDHVIERGERQRLRSNATRNCSRRGKKEPFAETNTLLGISS